MATKISARAGNDENAPSATVEYNFGDNLAEAVELFGEDVVYNRFKAAVTIDIQALVRRHLTPTVDKDGKETSPAKTEKEIQELVKEWKPGVSTRKRLSAKDKAAKALDELSDEEKQELIRSLMGEAAPASKKAGGKK